jgi:hypothetical protein
MAVDTLRYSEELQEAGLDARLARAHAQALNRAIVDGVASKADILAAEQRLMAYISVKLGALETRLAKDATGHVVTIIIASATVAGIVVAAGFTLLPLLLHR